MSHRGYKGVGPREEVTSPAGRVEWGSDVGGQGTQGCSPVRMGYLPVRKAALLGVHTASAARCCVSLTPPSASRSMFGVLWGRGAQHGVGAHACTCNPDVSLTGHHGKS